MPRKSRRVLLGARTQRLQEQREDSLRELARQLRAEFRRTRDEGLHIGGPTS